MKRSASGLCGFCGSKDISAKKSAEVTSAIDIQLVGWPLPASDVDRIESMRRRVAMFCSAGRSAVRSVIELESLVQDARHRKSRRTKDPKECGAMAQVHRLVHQGRERRLRGNRR